MPNLKVENPHHLWLGRFQVVGGENSSSIVIFISMCDYLLLRLRGMRMKESKNITLKVNSKLYDEYRELCKKEGWIVSRQFEKLMEEEMKKREREN